MRHPILVSWLVAAAACAAGRAQQLVLEIRGAVADGFGAAVAGIGDADLDGWPDVLVGAPDANQGAGRAELRSGRDGRLLLAVNGSASGDRIGAMVGRLGDVDRDGRPDLLVVGAQVALVVSGATGAVWWQLPALRACGAGDADGDGHADVALARVGGVNGLEIAFVSGRTGLDLARFDVPAQESVIGMDGLGDVDGDGRDDVGVGIGHGTGTGGRTWVLSATSPAPLWQWSSPPGSGYVVGQSVAGVGDFDADGHADLAVGVLEMALVPPPSRNGGEVLVYSGRTGGILRRMAGSYWTDRYLQNQIYYRQYGTALAGGGDLDGDGRLDLLARETSSVAPVRLRSSTGPRAVEAAGAFAFGGDFDRDGFDDVIVGDAARGVLSVHGGPRRGTAAEREWWVGPRGGRLLRMTGIPDLNGDGVRDVLLARSDGSQSFNFITATEVLSGRTGDLIQVLTGPYNKPWRATTAVLVDLDADGRDDWATAWHGFPGGWVHVQRSARGSLQLPSGEWSFGAALAGGADWSGDGTGEVFVGVNAASAGIGAVEARSGLDGALLATLPGNGGGFGGVLCMPGDVDGDGVGDLLVGAPQESGTGVVRMYGARGTRVLWTITSATELLLALPDQDGDGRPDFALLVPGSGALEVRSGASGGLLRTVVAQGFAPTSAEVATDVDGDGTVDFVVGDPAQHHARVISGRSGATLLEFAGYPDGAGAHVAWVGDVAGATHVAVGSRNGGTYATGGVLLRRDDRGHARVARFGHGCRTALPAPDLTLSARPVLGSTPQLAMHALAIGAPTALVLGVSDTAFGGVPLPLSLGALGIPACVLWTSLEVTLPLSPGASALQVPWTLPADTHLIGARVFLQLAQVDATAGLTLRMSAGLRVVLGR